jgi:AraC family transcriptional activator of pobA
MSIARRAPRDLFDRECDGGADDDVTAFSISERLAHGPTELGLTAPDQRQFVFLYAGGGSIELDGTVFVLRPGATVSVPSGAFCVLRLQGHSEGICLGIRDAYFRSHVITAVPAVLQAGDRYWRAYYTPIVFNDFTGDAHRSRRDDMMRELTGTRRRLGLGCDPAVAAYMLVIMFEPHLLATRQSAPPTSLTTVQTSAPSLLLEFRNLIELHFLRHLQVHDYCEILKVTPRRLAQACRATTGQTPLSLIHDRIVLEAKRELRCSRKSISEIASALGFEDLGYFSRFIKQRTGQTPLSFRR